MRSKKRDAAGMGIQQGMRSAPKVLQITIEVE